ncbi:MAG: Tetratricopeptide repeat protein [Verrucomicrobia bacterium ADurb.Bin345]|nr:MAG: Tetratricopeptide repeat protein [Verrucomicrobia bacterium ADurb.Bin345]
MLIEGVPVGRMSDLPPEAAGLHALVRYWKKTSPSALARWQRENAGRYLPQELPFRLAWEHGLWATTGPGTMEQLKSLLRSGTPVLVVTQRNALLPDTRRYELVIGYDDGDGSVLVVGEGRDPYRVESYGDFERKWRVAQNRMTVLRPPEFDRLPLGAPELFDRARFHEAAGAYDAAVADYRAAADAGLGQSVLYVKLGNTLRSKGEVEDAEAAYRKAIALDPGNGQAFNNLAYILAERSKDLEEAAALARQAMVLDPANARVLDTLGFVLYRQERYREAADVLERARGRARSYPPEVQAEIAFRLVRAHLRNGDIHLAREVFRDARRMVPADRVPDDLRELLK